MIDSKIEELKSIKADKFKWKGYDFITACFYHRLIVKKLERISHLIEEKTFYKLYHMLRSCEQNWAIAANKLIDHLIKNLQLNS